MSTPHDALHIVPIGCRSQVDLIALADFFFCSIGASLKMPLGKLMEVAKPSDETSKQLRKEILTCGGGLCPLVRDRLQSKADIKNTSGGNHQQPACRRR